MADWTGWTYYKTHVISGSAGAGTDYQIKVTVHYGNGTDSGNDVYLNSKSNTDFSDIRFSDSDGSNSLDYWLQEKTDSDNAIFWFEVLDDLDTDQTIRIYYGNAGASDASNGDNTFQFFDNFPGTSFDASKWTVIDMTLSGNKLSASANNGRIIGKTTFSDPIALEARWSSTFINDSNKQNFLACQTSVGGTGYFGGNLCPRLNTDDLQYYTGSWNLLYSGITASTYYRTKIVNMGTANGLNYYVYDDNGSELASAENKFRHNINTPNNAVVGAWGAGVKCDIYVTWFFVRKFVSPEPSHGEWGSQTPPDPKAETPTLIGKAVLRKDRDRELLPLIKMFLESEVI